MEAANKRTWKVDTYIPQADVHKETRRHRITKKVSEERPTYS